MPHNDFNSEELERWYPSLQAPEELDLEDLSRLENDGLYNAGMEVVQEILREMAAAGRTRRSGQQRHRETDRGNTRYKASRWEVGSQGLQAQELQETEEGRQPTRGLVSAKPAASSKLHPSPSTS